MGKNLLILIFLAFASSIGAQTYDLTAKVAVETAAGDGAKAMTLTELKSIVASGLGTGSVTSVAVAVPSGFSISGSPITTSGTMTIATALSGVLKGTGTGFTTATA